MGRESIFDYSRIFSKLDLTYVFLRNLNHKKNYAINLCLNYVFITDCQIDTKIL